MILLLFYNKNPLLMKNSFVVLFKCHITIICIILLKKLFYQPNIKIFTKVMTLLLFHIKRPLLMKYSFVVPFKCHITIIYMILFEKHFY